MHTNQEFEDLFSNLAKGSITRSELDRLINLLDQLDLDDELMYRIKLELKQPTLLEDSTLVRNIAFKAKSNIMQRTSTFKPIKPRRIYTKAIWWAASLLLMSGLVIHYFIDSRRSIKAEKNNSIAVQDITAGGNNAVLTLSNGERFVLDSTKSQLISNENSLAYNDGKNVRSLQDSIYNLTLTTSRRGQYQAILPDGTKVWLNAESKISYPSRFEGYKRIVYIEGEIYFEVAKKLGTKFIVQMEGGREVEVLGTQFNINAYSNYSDIKTTLLEGSVKVVSTDLSSVTLKPNEQASQKKNRPTIQVRKVNAENVVAWKNNKFNFEGLRFEEIMSQIERWYDVEVEYKSKVPDFEFYGDIGRHNTLLYVLKAFENSDIKLELKGNKILVY